MSWETMDARRTDSGIPVRRPWKSLEEILTNLLQRLYIDQEVENRLPLGCGIASIIFLQSCHPITWLTTNMQTAKSVKESEDCRTPKVGWVTDSGPSILTRERFHLDNKWTHRNTKLLFSTGNPQFGLGSARQFLCWSWLDALLCLLSW